MILRGRRRGALVWWLAAGAIGVVPAATYLVGRMGPARTPTVVSLTFDDGFKSQWTARSVLAAHGYRATFYINSARLGQARRLTAAQVRLLADEGHEIGGHTLDHVELPKYKRDMRLRQICDDRLRLTRLLGTDAVRSFAYPYGASGPGVERDVASCGYNSARIVGGLNPEAGGCNGCPDAESASPRARFKIRSSPSFVVSTPLSRITAQIAKAQRSGGGWIPLVFHEVCDGCSRLAISTADFTALLGWMRVRGVTVRTVDQVIGGDTRPAVASNAIGLVAVGEHGWWPSARWTLLAVVALLFGLPIGGLAAARRAGRW